jgi:hypothetical protein
MLDGFEGLFPTPAERLHHSLDGLLVDGGGSGSGPGGPFGPGHSSLFPGGLEVLE